MNFFDLHCDTPYECFKQGLPFNNNVLAVTSKKGSVFDKWHQCFAIWVRDDMPSPFKFYKSVLNDFKFKLSTKPDNLSPILMVEGGAVIEQDLSRVERLKNDGIRALTLTWNGENSIAGGSQSDAPLKDFGKQVILELNRNKMICDLSHINRKGFFKALEIADYPMVTHTCCDSIHSHKRNLNDGQIKALVQKNGIIGICFYPAFLGGNNVFEQVYKNIYHLLNMGYENNIAIGSDFDGADMDCKLFDISDVPALYRFLHCRGIECGILEKIFFRNAFNFFNNL